MDDRRNDSGFSAPCSYTQGVTKRTSTPLATAESRWWKSGALGGSDGRRERDGRKMKGKGVELDRGSNSRPTPALLRKKWLGRAVILCFSVLPISPGKTDLWSTQDVVSWREGRTSERRLKKRERRMEKSKHGQKPKEGKKGGRQISCRGVELEEVLLRHNSWSEIEWRRRATWVVEDQSDKCSSCEPAAPVCLMGGRGDRNLGQTSCGHSV